VLPVFCAAKLERIRTEKTMTSLACFKKVLLDVACGGNKKAYTRKGHLFEFAARVEDIGYERGDKRERRAAGD